MRKGSRRRSAVSTRSADGAACHLRAFVRTPEMKSFFAFAIAEAVVRVSRRQGLLQRPVTTRRLRVLTEVVAEVDVVGEGLAPRDYDVEVVWRRARRPQEALFPGDPLVTLVDVAERPQPLD